MAWMRSSCLISRRDRVRGYANGVVKLAVRQREDVIAKICWANHGRPPLFRGMGPGKLCAYRFPIPRRCRFLSCTLVEDGFSHETDFNRSSSPRQRAGLPPFAEVAHNRPVTTMNHLPSPVCSRPPPLDSGWDSLAHWTHLPRVASPRRFPSSRRRGHCRPVVENSPGIICLYIAQLPRSESSGVLRDGTDTALINKLGGTGGIDVG